MYRVADSGRAVCQLIALSRKTDYVLHRARLDRRVHQEQISGSESDAGDRRKILEYVVGKFAVNARVDREGPGDMQHRVPVRRRLCDDVRAYDAVGAGTVVHD